MKSFRLTAIFVISLLLSFGTNAFAGKFVRVSADLLIHYEEVGSGAPLVFIPGWSSSTEYYDRQLAYFSKNYRAIAFDPRSQGLSSKTLENNHYVQHGADLKAFFEALQLKDVVLIGHSNGCYDIYAYVRGNGVEYIKAVIAIDCSPPKQLWTEEGDEWIRFKEAREMTRGYMAINYKRTDVLAGLFQKMVTRELVPEETNFFVQMVAKTPNHVSTLLLLDGHFSDYVEEAKLIGSNVPVLYVLGEDGFFGKPPETAQAWIRQNMPNAETAVFGKHLLHWEFPEKFNSIVDGFLAKLD